MSGLTPDPSARIQLTIPSKTVEFECNKFAVILDGQKVIEATDDGFSAAGKVGVWTKADSVTLLDDFSYGGKQAT